MPIADLSLDLDSAYRRPDTSLCKEDEYYLPGIGQNIVPVFVANQPIRS